MTEILENIALCVERGKVNSSSQYPVDMKGLEGVDELTKKAVETGIPPADILNHGLIAGMYKIGIKFKENKVFIPDVLIAAKAMNAGMVHIKPFFLSNEIKIKGKVVIGTVAGDLHDIGKNILGMILQGGGWEVIDLKVDVPAEKFLQAVEEHNPKAVCLSALLTTTMLNMENVVNKIKLQRPDVKILVGGAPLSLDYSNKIGADFYSPDPQGALDYLNNLELN